MTLQRLVGAGIIYQRIHKNKPRWSPLYVYSLAKRECNVTLWQAILPYMHSRRGETLRQALEDTRYHIEQKGKGKLCCGK